MLVACLLLFFRFAAVFLLLCLLSCFACPLACLVCSCVFVVFVVVSFSLTDYTQKEKGAIPCVLSSCVVGVQNLVQLSKNSVAVALAFSLRLLCSIRYYETIASRFNPERVACYPSDRKIKAIIAYYLITVSAFALHHHPAIIVCSCLGGAWVGVCFAECEDVAAVVGVNKVLSLFGVVVDCFHCFVILLFDLFSFPLSDAGLVLHPLKVEIPVIPL